MSIIVQTECVHVYVRLKFVAGGEGGGLFALLWSTERTLNSSDLRTNCGDRSLVYFGESAGNKCFLNQAMLCILRIHSIHC